MTDAWPGQFTPTILSIQVENQSRSGGPSLLGSEQVVSSGSGRLTARASIVVKNSADVRAWRAFVSRRRGKAEPLLFPMFDCGRGGGGTLVTYFDDDGLRTEFTDGFAFIEETVVIMLAADAPLRATEITVTSADKLAEGVFIGLGGERAHIVEAVEGTAPTWALSISPPLRQAYSAGTAVNQQIVHCLMRLQSDLTGEMELDLLRLSRPNVDLVEVF